MAVETLCWSCGNACTRGCSWSDRGIPVKGWKAVRNKDNQSYHVVSCPKFCKSSRLKDLDDDGAQMLAAEIIKQVIFDYTKGAPETAISLERFVRGRRFRAIASVDPEHLIKLMRERRKEYQTEKQKRLRKALQGVSEASEKEI